VNQRVKSEIFLQIGFACSQILLKRFPSLPQLRFAGKDAVRHGVRGVLCGLSHFGLARSGVSLALVEPRLLASIWELLKLA